VSIKYPEEGAEDLTAIITITRNSQYTSTDKFALTFSWQGVSRNFTVQTITALADYDLILPARVIKKGSEPENFAIQALKKTNDGTFTLENANSD
jgi:hypothetical protein